MDETAKIFAHLNITPEKHPWAFDFDCEGERTIPFSLLEDCEMDFECRHDAVRADGLAWRLAVIMDDMRIYAGIESPFEGLGQHIYEYVLADIKKKRVFDPSWLSWEMINNEISFIEISVKAWHKKGASRLSLRMNADREPLLLEIKNKMEEDGYVLELIPQDDCAFCCAILSWDKDSSRVKYLLDTWRDPYVTYPVYVSINPII